MKTKMVDISTSQAQQQTADARGFRMSAYTNMNTTTSDVLSGSKTMQQMGLTANTIHSSTT